MKKFLFVLVAICMVVPVFAFDPSVLVPDAPRVDAGRGPVGGEGFNISVTGGMEAALTFQRISYVDFPYDRREPVSNPLWVAGFGRNGHHLPRFSLGAIADLNGIAGFHGSLNIYPPFLDNRVTGDFDGVPVRQPLEIHLALMHGWYQPFSWMRVNAGTFALTELMGQIRGFGWGEYLGVRAGGTDTFFNRFAGNNAVALEVINPVSAFGVDNPWLDNIYLGVMLYDIYVSRIANNAGIHGGIRQAKYVFENLHIALGYEIPNIGLLRLQFINAKPMSNARRIVDGDFTDDNAGPRSQAAFTFTMVPNLKIEVGGTLSHLVVDPYNRIPALTVDGEYEMAFVIQAGEYLNHHRVIFGIEYNFIDLLGIPLSVRGGVEYNFGGFTAPYGAGRVETSPLTKIWLSPSYTIGSFYFGVDLGLNIIGDELRFGRLFRRGGYRYGFGAFAQWNGIGNAFIRTGVAVAGGEALGFNRVTPRLLDTTVTIPFLFGINF